MQKSINELHRLQYAFKRNINLLNEKYVKHTKNTDVRDGLYFRYAYLPNETSQDKATARVNDIRNTYLTGNFSVPLVKQSYLKKDNIIQHTDYDLLNESIRCINQITSGSIDKPTQELIAVDGMHLPLLKELNKDGFKMNLNNEAIESLCIVAHEVVHNSPVLIKLMKHKNERKSFLEQEDIIRKYRDAIFIFDRGFVSNELMYFLVKNNLKFVMRVKSNTYNIHDKKDAIVRIIHLVNTFNIRVVNYVKEHQHYYLATNLVDKNKYNITDLGEIYNRRWEVEEYIKYLRKNFCINDINESSENKIRKTLNATITVSLLVSFITCLHYKYHKVNYNAKINKTTLTTGIIDWLLPRLIYDIKIGTSDMAYFIKVYIKYTYNKENRTCIRKAVRPYRKWYIRRHFSVNKSGYKNTVNRAHNNTNTNAHTNINTNTNISTSLDANLANIKNRIKNKYKIDTVKYQIPTTEDEINKRLFIDLDF